MQVCYRMIRMHALRGFETACVQPHLELIAARWTKSKPNGSRARLQ